MRRKQFKSTLADVTVNLSGQGKVIPVGAVKIPPICTVIEFDESTVSLRRFDFKKYYGHGCDNVVFACQQVIERMVCTSRKTLGQSLSMTSIIAYCNRGVAVFIPFCITWAQALGRDLNLSDIGRDLIQRFIKSLASSDRNITTQKNNYTLTKSMLMDLVRLDLLSRDIFPRNPFPNINRKKKGEKALSNRERVQTIQAIGDELRRISKEEGPLSLLDLGICALGLAARTGLNPTPLIELPLDCLQPHPLKASHQLLVSYKRRGKNTHIQSIRKSSEIDLLMSVRAAQVGGIIDLVVARNNSIRSWSNYPNSLFVGESRGGSSRGEGRRLTSRLLNLAAANLVEKHEIMDDDGKLVNLNVMRLRKTFSNRIWELSGQDPFVSAALTGHGVRVQNDHYLEAPREAEKNWRFMGKVLVTSLLEGGKNASMVENTPVARCADNFNGARAPKNGSHCTNFLSCFICKSFLVTGDDLYRVYSLYWLLIKERERIGRRAWSKYYENIIRVVDDQIAPKFDPNEVARARIKAKKTPHPFWRDSKMLEGAHDT